MILKIPVHEDCLDRLFVVSTTETTLKDVSQMLSGQGVDPTSLLSSSEGV